MQRGCLYARPQLSPEDIGKLKMARRNNKVSE